MGAQRESRDQLSVSWSDRLTESSFHSVFAVCGLVGIASVVLWYGLLTDQFQIAYIWNSSERSLPAFYKFAAIWGGQAGSLLFLDAPAQSFQYGGGPDTSNEPAHVDALRQCDTAGDAPLLSCPAGLQR